MIFQIRKRLSIFCKTYYNLLLICLILIFIFRPFNASITYLGIWKVLLTGTILAAVFNCKRSRINKIVEVVVAFPAILFCWLDIFFPLSWVSVTGIIFNVLFTLIATMTIIHDVLVRSRVTAETLKGVICAYFLVAVAFAYIFWLIEYFDPGSFFISPPHPQFDYYTQYLSELIYFSFVTLLTIGYGDIVAIKQIGQTAVILEGIIGQFYIAILVAGLISSRSKKQSFEKEFLDEDSK